MKHLYRIKLVANKSYLVREYCGVTYFVNIGRIPKRVFTKSFDYGEYYEVFGPNLDKTRLQAAKSFIRSQIARVRGDRRDLQKVLSMTFQAYKCGGVYLTPNSVFNCIKQRKLRIINKEKKPFNLKRHVGVEMEFRSTHDSDEIKDELIKAGLDKYVNLTTDGSISVDGGDCDGSCRDNCTCNYCGGDICDSADECHGEHDCNCECTCSDGSGYCYGHELRVIAPQTEIYAVISKVCKVLNEQCDVDVNDSCGLHVHLDMRGRNRARSFRNLVAAQKLLYSMVPKSRRDNTYCKFSNTKELDLALVSHPRYMGINCQSIKEHKTIEVRIHSGTTSSTKINNWIRLLLAIIHSKSSEAPNTFEQAIKQYNLKPELVAYIAERLTKFRKEHGDWGLLGAERTELAA